MVTSIKQTLLKPLEKNLHTSYLSKQASLSLGVEKLKRKAAMKDQGNLQRYRSNPWAYAQEVLGVWWTPAQRKVAKAILKHKRVLVKAAHGVGKTHLMGGLVNWYFDVWPSSISMTTAPTFPQVEKLLWGEIRAQRTLPPVSGVTQIKDPGNAKHYAVGRSPSKRAGRDEMGSQAFQGVHAEHLMVVFDEGAGVSDDRWSVVDGGLVVGTENKFVVIGNPVVTSGPFFEAARDPRWHVIEMSALDHPNIAAGLRGEPDVVPGAVSLTWLEDKLENPFWCELMGTPANKEEREAWILDGCFEFPPMEDIWYRPGASAEARILGRFPSNPTNSVWSSIWLDQAAQRHYAWAPGEPWEIGVDVARFGDDATCVHTRRGMCSISHDTWRKMNTMETVGRIMNIVNSQEAYFGPDDLPVTIIIRVDTTGGDVGTGVADGLAEVLTTYSNVDLYTIGAAERPYDIRKYQNKRSELWFNAATWGQQGELDITRLNPRDVELLTAQLTSSKYKYDSQSKRVVEPKKDVKERIGRSPDDADAFNLAWYTRGREYANVDYRNVDLRKENVWKGPEQSPRWGGGDSAQTRSWAVGTSTRRRFSS